MSKHDIYHEAADLSATITHNYELYINEDQTRDERGRLKDPLAQTFEQRMNKALESYKDLARYAGEAIILAPSEAS